ncbi:hypothetical protein C6A85_97080, partial [Mycobacterium sp. ITM-2017-0098]
MKRTVVARSAAVAAAVALIATGCTSSTSGSGQTAAQSTTTTTSAEATSTSTSATAAPSTGRIAPRQEAPQGPAPTIADYIKENGIQESAVKPGDPGSPIIDLPVPEGWEPAGEETP